MEIIILKDNYDDTLFFSNFKKNSKIKIVINNLNTDISNIIISYIDLWDYISNNIKLT